MSEVRRTIHAPPEAVWAVLAEPTSYPDWLVGAQVIRSVEGDFPEPGSEFHHAVGPSERLALPDSTTVLEADAPHQLSLKVRARPFFDGIVRFRLLPTKAGTELLMDEEPVGLLRFFAPLLRPLVVARNATSLERLRDLVESRAATTTGERPAG